MSYTPPDLSEVLTNEQTMNSRLTTCRNNLRTILTKEEIGYTEGDGIIPLIRKLPVPELASMTMTLNNPFSTGASVTGTVTAKDTNGETMVNVPIQLYRVVPNGNSPSSTFLGNYTTNSNGEADITVPLPDEKGMFYVQARSGNIICGEYGMYCTTAIGPEDLGYTITTNLFSSNGTGANSGFDIVDLWDEEDHIDLTIEAQSDYSGEYFGLLLPQLGTYNKTSVQNHPAAILMHDITAGNKARWMGFGFVANPTDASNIAICGASKYNYGDGTGSAGYRQLFVGFDYSSSSDNGSPENPSKKLYNFYGSGATVYDYYTGDASAQYPDAFNNHGTWSSNLDFMKSGDGNFAVIFNMGGVSGTYRTFRIYRAGVI